MEILSLKILWAIMQTHLYTISIQITSFLNEQTSVIIAAGLLFSIETGFLNEQRCFCKCSCNYVLHKCTKLSLAQCVICKIKKYSWE